MITKTTITNPLPFPTMLPFCDNLDWGPKSDILHRYEGRPDTRITHWRHLAEAARGAEDAALVYMLKSSNYRFYVCISMNVVIHFVIVVFVIINYN